MQMSASCHWTPRPVGALIQGLPGAHKVLPSSLPSSSCLGRPLLWGTASLPCCLTQSSLTLCLSSLGS